MKFLSLHSKPILRFYIFLTIIKLFTVNIYSQREEDPTIYIKIHPTLYNTFKGSDRYIELYNNKYSWYKNHQYVELFHSNGSNAVEYGYSSLIFLWWLMTASVIILKLYNTC